MGYFVYIVHLKKAAARKLQDRARVRRGGKVFYVGQTALSDAARLAAHLSGDHTSNRDVRDYAISVVGHDGPYATREQAEREERRWALRIRHLGHVVVGGH